MAVVVCKTVVGLRASCRKTLPSFHEVCHTFALLDECDVQQKIHMPSGKFLYSYISTMNLAQQLPENYSK
jgi:hypothetical protein